MSGICNPITGSGRLIQRILEILFPLPPIPAPEPEPEPESEPEPEPEPDTIV